MPVDPVCHYRFADGIELRPAQRVRAARSRGAWDDGARRRRRAPTGPGSWTGPARIWDATRETVPGVPAGRRCATLLRAGPPGRATCARSRRGGRCAGWAGSYLRDPHLRTLLDRYATYTGSDPRRAPAALATVPYVEQTFGAWYVPRRPAPARRRRRTSAPWSAARVVRTGAAVVAVVLGGAAGQRGAAGRRRAAARRRGRVRRRRRATSTRDCCRARRRGPAARRAGPGDAVALRVRRCCWPCAAARPGLAHHTVLFPADYDDEFDSVFGAGPHRGPAPPGARPDRLHQRARRPRAAARRRPRVLVRAGQRPAACVGRRRRRGHRLGRARAGPRPTPTGSLDGDGRARASTSGTGCCGGRSARRPTSSAATGSVGGSIYGTSSNGARAAFLRPANRSPVPGLFLVGGSAHPGGGLPLVGLSAAIVAGLVGPA